MNFFKSIGSLLRNKCPRCRKGDIYKNKNPYRLKKLYAMHGFCPVCGQKIQQRIGYWYIANYITYALSLAFSFITLVLYWMFIGITWRDNSIFHWFIANCLLLLAVIPLLIRLGRTLYLYFTVRYDPGKQEPRDENLS